MDNVFKVEHSGMDRRNFLKGAVTVGATAAVGASLAACTSSNSGSGSSSASGSSSDIAWDYETEVLVVGRGGGGCVAAITAVEEGASALILEKDDTGEGGGSSRMSGGNFMWIKEGMTEEAVAHLSKIACGTVDEDVIRAYVEEGEQQLDWMDDHDLEYCLIAVDSTATFTAVEGSDAFQCATFCTEDNPINDEGGHVFYEWSVEQLDALGIEVVYDAAAYELIQDASTKEILGVKATIGGEDKNVRATKAVVVATGGFSANAEMVNNYLTPAPMKTVACRYSTGDGLKMMQRIGADIWHMNTYNMHGYGFSTDDDEMVRSDITLDDDGGAYIFIDSSGTRFCNESSIASGNNGHYCNYAFMADPDQTLNAFNYGHTPFYCIFDESKRLLNPVYFNTVHGADRPGWTNFENWSEDNSEEIEKGWILKADTIEELVELINENSADEGYALDASVVADTISTYNSYCEAGEDKDFGRDASVTITYTSGYGDDADEAFRDRDLSSDTNNLVPIECPPYYAIRLAPVLYTTNGCAKKNAKSQVLDVDGNVIPRLYTAGVDGSATAMIYSIGGQNWGDVLNWGRISGRNAAAEESLA